MKTPKLIDDLNALGLICTVEHKVYEDNTSQWIVELISNKVHKEVNKHIEETINGDPGSKMIKKGYPTKIFVYKGEPTSLTVYSTKKPRLYINA